MTDHFGQVLKGLRLRAKIGLRRFAETIDMQPSNLSAIEHGRRSPPTDDEALRSIAEALGLDEGSSDWEHFFDCASRPGELPVDVRHMADRNLVPTLLRTIDNQQLDEEEIGRLIDLIKKPNSD